MKVSLFLTCIDQVFSQEVGKSTVEILERLGCEVDYPKGQTCCGQVAYNGGYRNEAIKGAKQTIKVFQNSSYVVTPSGSCAAMIHSYPALLQDDKYWLERATELKNKTYELTQFIVDVLEVTDVNAKYEAKATYHKSCHMTRLLQVTDSPLVLLNNVEGLEMVPLSNDHDCCGFGGTFAVKMPSISEEMVDEKVNHIVNTEAQVIIGSDNSCLMNIGGRINRRNKKIEVLHIAEVLNNIYE